MRVGKTKFSAYLVYLDKRYPYNIGRYSPGVGELGIAIKLTKATTL